jgi:hypothetical protein
MVTRLVTKAKKLREEEEENKRGVSSEDGWVEINRNKEDKNKV